MRVAADVKWLDCEIVQVSPPVCAVSAWPTQVEVVCRVLTSVLARDANMDQNVNHCMTRKPFAQQRWVLSARTSPDGLAFSAPLLPASCTLGRLPCEAFLNFRFQIPVGAAGMFSITVVPSDPVVPSGQVQQSTLLSICEVPAMLPIVTATSGNLLVAPSLAVAEELLGVFNGMRSVIAAQSQEQAGSNQLQLPDSDCGGEMTAYDKAAVTCWCEHFHLLLQDLHQVLLSSFSTAPAVVSRTPEPAVGSLYGEPVELVFCSLLEYLAMHDCWCSVSYVLAESHKSGLLQSPGVAAVAQKKQLAAVMHCGLAGLQTAAGLTASLILSVTAAEQPGVTAAEELEVTAAEGLLSSKCKRTMFNTVHNTSSLTQVDAAAAGPMAGHSAAFTVAPLQLCRTKQAVSGMVALLLLVLLTAAAPLMQNVLMDTSSPTRLANDAAQLPMQYCTLLVTVLLTMLGFSSWSG